MTQFLYSIHYVYAIMHTTPMLTLHFRLFDLQHNFAKIWVKIIVSAKTCFLVACMCLSLFSLFHFSLSSRSAVCRKDLTQLLAILLIFAIFVIILFLALLRCNREFCNFLCSNCILRRNSR